MEYKCDFLKIRFILIDYVILHLHNEFFVDRSNPFRHVLYCSCFDCFCFLHSSAMNLPKKKSNLQTHKFQIFCFAKTFLQFLFSGTLCGGRCCGNDSEEELTIKSTNNFYRMLRHHTRSLRTILESTAKTFRGECWNVWVILRLEFWWAIFRYFFLASSFHVHDFIVIRRYTSIFRNLQAFIYKILFDYELPGSNVKFNNMSLFSLVRGSTSRYFVAY